MVFVKSGVVLEIRAFITAVINLTGGKKVNFTQLYADDLHFRSQAVNIVVAASIERNKAITHMTEKARSTPYRASKVSSNKNNIYTWRSCESRRVRVSHIWVSEKPGSLMSVY